MALTYMHRLEELQGILGAALSDLGVIENKLQNQIIERDTLLETHMLEGELADFPAISTHMNTILGEIEDHKDVLVDFLAEFPADAALFPHRVKACKHIRNFRAYNDTGKGKVVCEHYWNDTLSTWFYEWNGFTAGDLVSVDYGDGRVETVAIDTVALGTLTFTTELFHIPSSITSLATAAVYSKMVVTRIADYT